MTIVSLQLDPAAVTYTDNQIVDKVNLATTDITRASSVSAGARPITAGEVGATELAAGAVKTKVEGETNANKLATAALQTSAGLTSGQLAASAAKDSLDAMSDTARGYVKTSPLTGEFPVVAIQRDAAGLLDVDYDNVAV